MAVQLLADIRHVLFMFHLAWEQSDDSFDSWQVGWKHQDAVATLEEARKVKSAAFYAEKKKQIALKSKARSEAQAAA